MDPEELARRCQEYLRSHGVQVNIDYIRRELASQRQGEPASSHAGCWISEFIREHPQHVTAPE